MREYIDEEKVNVPTPEEYAEVRIELLQSVLDSPRVRHMIAEGYEEVPIW
ncbi:hypothetical protein [Natronolimnohabitans innermongolicus]|nr:hypothetical protein [Natronolimnohabitans innermongolicus]